MLRWVGGATLFMASIVLSDGRGGGVRRAPDGSADRYTGVGAEHRRRPPRMVAGGGTVFMGCIFHRWSGWCCHQRGLVAAPDA
jgi:hypothetical protein